MVSFVSPEQSNAEFRRRGFDELGLIGGSRADARLKCSAFTYQSRVKNADLIAEALTQELGEFSDCLVWACRRVLGDRTGEGDSSPDWDTYQSWRDQHGATLPLSEQPGHRFVENEQAALKQLIASALYLGWDTLLKSDASKTVVKLSHDDRIELHYFSSPALLKSELARLCKPAPWFDPKR